MRLLSLFLCLFLSLQMSAYADEKDKPTTISPWLYKKLIRTEKLIEKKKYLKAEQKLIAMLADVDKPSYEQATVLRSLSSVYVLKGTYKKAAEILSKVVKLNVLPKDQEQQAFLNLGQLYMSIEQYSKAIQILEPWLKNNSSSNSQINVLLANAYTQLKKYRKAVPFIKKAIANSKKPEESWYQLNLALYFELEEYSSAAKILKQLIRRYPDKKQYWQQLVATYQQLKQYKKAVSVKYLAYKKGYITTEKDIVALANLFLVINSPYKAAKVLKQEINNKRVKSNSKNWELLATAWSLAKEYDAAILALETASKFNDKGGLSQRLGQIYVEQEQWSKAVSSLNKALNKGGLQNTGATYLLLGMSYYELKNNQQAKKAFLKAAKYNKHKKAANQWLVYISHS